MASEIPNATEVASEKVEVPPDPGCHLVRAFYVGANRWHTFDSTRRTAEEAIGSAWAARSTGKYLATRIIRIPPQGEQVSRRDVVGVDRADLDGLIKLADFAFSKSNEDNALIDRVRDVVKGGA